MKLFAQILFSFYFLLNPLAFAFNADASKEEIELGIVRWILAEHRPDFKHYHPLSKTEIDDVVSMVAQKEWARFGYFGSVVRFCVDGPQTKMARKALNNIGKNLANVDQTTIPLVIRSFFFDDVTIEFKEVAPVCFAGGTLAIGGTLQEKQILSELGLSVADFCIMNAMNEKGINYIADVTNPEHMKNFSGFNYAVAHAIPIDATHLPQILINTCHALSKQGVLFAKFLISETVDLSEEVFIKAGFKQVKIFAAQDGMVGFVAAKFSVKHSVLDDWLNAEAATPFMRYFNF